MALFMSRPCNAEDLEALSLLLCRHNCEVSERRIDDLEGAIRLLMEIVLPEPADFCPICKRMMSAGWRGQQLVERVCRPCGRIWKVGGDYEELTKPVTPTLCPECGTNHCNHMTGGPKPGGG